MGYKTKKLQLYQIVGCFIYEFVQLSGAMSLSLIRIGWVFRVIILCSLALPGSV